MHHAYIDNWIRERSDYRLHGRSMVYIIRKKERTSKQALVVEWLTYSLRVEFRT